MSSMIRVGFVSNTNEEYTGKMQCDLEVNDDIL